ncbi:MAG: DUF302 domain-containing protein [Cocleimonas sp.]
MTTPLPKKELKQASKQPVTLYFLIMCVFFTLGYGSNEWLGKNDLAQGVAEHVSKIEAEKASNTTQNNDSSSLSKTTTDTLPSYASIFSTEASFEDAKADLLESISGKGLVISYTSHAKTMLDNTAAVSGVTKPVYENAEILLFCKADLSHALVAANPHNIVLCPYNISIYVLSDEPEKVYLSFRKGEKSEAKTKAIDALLVEIIEEVI